MSKRWYEGWFEQTIYEAKVVIESSNNFWDNPMPLLTALTAVTVKWTVELVFLLAIVVMAVGMVLGVFKMIFM